MNLGGYHHNSFFRDLDQYVLSADVAKLRTQLGIVATASAGTPAGSPAPVLPHAQGSQAAQ